MMGMITAAKYPMITVPRYTCQRPELNLPTFCTWIQTWPPVSVPIGFTQRSYGKTWENMRKPASLPILPLEQHPGSELSSPIREMWQGRGDGRQKCNRNSQTLDSSTLRHQSCNKQLVHNKFMICIFYTVFMRHSHMAIPTAGKTGERTWISHWGLLWQQIIKNNH